MKISLDSGADRSTLDALVDFIKARLVKPAALQPGHAAAPALAETADRFNDSSWFWTDDNAKAAELLCSPRFYDADQSTADAAIDFVLLMSKGEVIQRRGGPAELRVSSGDPAAFRVETAFFAVEGDLTRGEVFHSLRFNDNRSVQAVKHGGHWVSFRYRGRRVTLDAQNHITHYAIRPNGRSVELSYTCTLPALRLWPGSRERSLGEVEFRTCVSADLPTLALSIQVTPRSGVVMKDVVLGTVLDQLAATEVDFRAVVVRAGERDIVHRSNRAKSTVHLGAAEYSAVIQEGRSPGFCYAVHTLFGVDARLASITARAFSRGRIHRVVHQYRLGTVTAQTPAEHREERMLTGGGYYDVPQHYATVMRDGAGGGFADPSMTYDIGAELNAVAVHLLFSLSGHYTRPPTPERIATLRAWYDRHVNRYFSFVRPGEAGDLRRVFTRGLAFVILSLDCMLRATGEGRYRDLLVTGIGLVLRLARPDKRGDDNYATFGDVWSGQIPFLDCQAACILALARGAWHGDSDGTIARAVHDSILSIRLYSGTIDIGRGQMMSYDGLAVIDTTDPQSHADTGFWNFKLGLVARALHATRRASSCGVIPMNETERRRLNRRLSLATSLLSRSCRRHGPMIEVRTSFYATETNSETQPWVALGVVPLTDALIERILIGSSAHWRVPPEDFDESAYLLAHPDVSDAVHGEEFDSGLHHWFNFGEREGRALAPST